MDAKEYETIYAVEDRHWWYAGMQRITTTLLSGYCPGRQDLEILDAGCGTGGAMGHLASLGTVTGCDLSALALSFCQKRGLARSGRHRPWRSPSPASVLTWSLLLTCSITAL